MDRKKYLTKLIVSCLLQNVCSSCAIDKLRNTSLVELIKLLNNMSDMEVLYINQQHVRCLKSRQSEIEKNSEIVYETVMTM